MTNFQREYIIKLQVAHLKSAARAALVGKCGTYTREAIEAGGLRMVKTPSARNFGPIVMRAGYERVALDAAALAKMDNSSAQVGDVVIFAGPLPHGHMQMWSGTHWVSDFVQLGKKTRSGFWPGDSFLPHLWQAYRLKKGT